MKNYFIMKHLFIVLLFLLFGSYTALSKQTITGTVTNAETGDPIPGVSVVVKEQTSIGTSTDMEGQYSLSIPSEAENLVFSFVGMQSQEVEIGGGQPLTLHCNLQLKRWKK